MVIRAVFCSLILLAQPLAAWAGVMAMPAAADSVAVSDHCADMSELGDESPAQPDCDISCDDCVAAAGMAPVISLEFVHPVMIGSTPFVLAFLPPGNADSPFRPPSFA